MVTTVLVLRSLGDPWPITWGHPHLPLSFWFGSHCHLRGEHYGWGLVSLTCESYWVLYNFVFSHLAKIPWSFLMASSLILMRVSVFEAHSYLTFAIMKMTFFSICVPRMSLGWPHGLRCQHNFTWLCPSFLPTLVPMPLTRSHETLLICICMDEIVVGAFALYTNTFFLNVWIITFLFSPLRYIC